MRCITAEKTAISLILFLAAQFFYYHEEKGERRVDEVFSTLRVQNISGSIEIRGWDKDHSLVRYTRQGPFADELEVVIELQNQTLSVYPVHANKMRKPPASVSGPVTLNAFKELNTRVALKSTSGTVHCEFPIQTAVRNNNLLEGTIGEGSSSPRADQ